LPQASLLLGMTKGGWRSHREELLTEGVFQSI
jgi:hypothetical protein